MKKDYYSVLVRAVSDVDPADSEARRAVYDRARFAMARAPLTLDEIRRERLALEAAIRRIESENAGTRGTMRPRGGIVDRPLDETTDTPTPTPMTLARLTGRPLVFGLAAAMVLIIGFFGYDYWRKTTAEKIRAFDPAPVQIDRTRSSGAPDEQGHSYIFNRQLVYYRSIHPAGTIVITKSQNFLYLIRPNTAALRYTIGVGRECTDIVGLLLVSAKEDWSERTSGMLKDEGRPTLQATGGRFGVRSLALSDTGHRIHGSDEPLANRMIGCLPLVNDDVVDLYERVTLGTRVVMN